VNCAAACGPLNVIALKMTALIAHELLIKINNAQRFIDNAIDTAF